MELSDAELVDRIRIGGRSGWGQVFRQYRVDLVSAVMRYRNDRAFADDVVQEVMLKLMQRNLPTTVLNLRAFLFTSVLNMAKDKGVQWGRQIPTEDVKVVADPVDIEDLVIKAMIASEVRRLVHLLPEAEQYAVAEHVLKGRTAVDVGKDLEVSGSRVNQLVKSGYEKLRPLIENQARTYEGTSEGGPPHE